MLWIAHSNIMQCKVENEGKNEASAAAGTKKLV